jgi:REP element-mobilizing transposase RayT
MGYPLRDETAGYHHVGTRGNNKQPIYLTDQDRHLFLFHVDRLADKHGWKILGHALMRNHYHLVIRIVEGGLAQGMCELNTTYAHAFNIAHGRENHLFGRRYWSELATSDEHLKNVVRYVLQNPRRAGASGPLETHPWTSYRASLGLEFGLKHFARDELLALFGNDPLRAVAAFKEFCETPPPAVPCRDVARVSHPPPKPRVSVT